VRPKRSLISLSLIWPHPNSSPLSFLRFIDRFSSSSGRRAPSSGRAFLKRRLPLSDLTKPPFASGLNDSLIALGFSGSRMNLSQFWLNSSRRPRPASSGSLICCQTNSRFFVLWLILIFLRFDPQQKLRLVAVSPEAQPKLTSCVQLCRGEAFGLNFVLLITTLNLPGLGKSGANDVGKCIAVAIYLTITRIPTAAAWRPNSSACLALDRHRHVA
jgi:hypothetical protein